MRLIHRLGPVAALSEHGSRTRVRSRIPRRVAGHALQNQTLTPIRICRSNTGLPAARAIPAVAPNVRTQE